MGHFTERGMERHHRKREKHLRKNQPPAASAAPAPLPDQQACCARKKPLTREQAHHTARLVTEDRKIACDPYRCTACGHWHVGRAKEARSDLRVLIRDQLMGRPR